MRTATALALSAFAAAAIGAPAAVATTKKPAGPTKPSLSFQGFSFNGLLVKNHAKVDDAQDCATLTANGQPQGNLHYAWFVKAAKIPSSAPTTVSFTMPTRYLAFGQAPTTTPFSKALVHKPYVFGGPPGSQKYIYWTGFTQGFPDGISTGIVDGTWGAKVSIKLPGKTLTATGTITVAC